MLVVVVVVGLDDVEEVDVVGLEPPPGVEEVEVVVVGPVVPLRYDTVGILGQSWRNHIPASSGAAEVRSDRDTREAGVDLGSRNEICGLRLRSGRVDVDVDTWVVRLKVIRHQDAVFAEDVFRLTPQAPGIGFR